MILSAGNITALAIAVDVPSAGKEGLEKVKSLISIGVIVIKSSHLKPSSSSTTTV